MTAPKTAHPLTSFSPQLTQALLRGSRERIEIPVPTKALGHRLQQRLNMLRRRLREQDRPDHAILAKARISLLWGTKAGFDKDLPASDTSQPAKVVIAPHDSEFEEVLSSVGISNPTVEPTPDSPSDEKNLDTLLEELEKKA